MGCDGVAAYGTDEGAGVVVLQLVVVGQRRAVGIEQSVGALVAEHLEAAVGRSEHPLLVPINLITHHFSLITYHFSFITSHFSLITPKRHALVNPFPYAAAGNAWCALDDFPLAVVVLE